MSQEKLDTYLSLCTQVYDLSKPTPPEDAYAFYRSYVESAGKAVLEPMCGTGRFLLPFVEELITILKEVGFKTVRIKAFDKTGKPDENDESIIYECRKSSVKSNFEGILYDHETSL